MGFYNATSDASNFVISFRPDLEQDFGAFAKGYALAASNLAEKLLEKSHFPDYEAYPVVFLYRHAFELYLKGFYYRAKRISFFKKSQSVEHQGKIDHSLVPFAETFQKICAALFSHDNELLQLADKIIRFANEFEEIDLDSFSYRYPMGKKGNKITAHHQIVNLFSFHQSMQELLDELEIIDFGLDMTEDQAKEIYEIFLENRNKIDSEYYEAG